MPKPSDAILPNLPQHPPDSVQTLVQVRERGTERDSDKVVARRVEEVSTVRGVDIEEDARDHDRLLFEELFKEGLVWGLVEDRGGGREMRHTRPLFKGGGR